MTATEWITKNPQLSKYTPRPHALCADGTVFSIQNGYSWHSDYDPADPESSTVEVACAPDAGLEWRDDGIGVKALGFNVYGHVPVPLLEQVIARHGGIVGPKEYD